MVEIIPGYGRMDEVLALVKEYTDMIARQSGDVVECLKSQHLDAELLDMEKKSGLPWGRLYLACADGKAAGCAAIARLDGEICELKRLYVRPEYRGRHIGNALMEQAISDARDIGYRYMRLDTFPFMEAAVRMYERRGFLPIEPYNDNPAAEAVFMELALF